MSIIILVDEEQQLSLISETPSIIKRSPTIQSSTVSVDTHFPATPRKINIRVDKEKEEENDDRHLTIPKVIAVSSSSETLTGKITFRREIRVFEGMKNHSIAANL